MSGKKAVKKSNKKNSNLRLVKSGMTKGKQKEKADQKEKIEQKIRFGRVKRLVILSAILILLLIALASGYIYIYSR